MFGGVEQTRHRSGYQPNGQRAGREAQTIARLPSGRSRRAPVAVAVRWGTAGFLLGASFWIYLGVLEFTGSGLPQPQGPPAPDCTSLALDRHNGRTTAAPCLGPAQSLRDTLMAWLGEASLQ
jgi:hypothetical protein